MRLPPPAFRASRFLEPGVGAKLGVSFPVPPSHNAGAPHDVGGQIFLHSENISMATLPIEQGLSLNGSRQRCSLVLPIDAQANIPLKAW